MNRLLAYGLWMLLGSSHASTIQCFKCEKPFPGAACPGFQDFCWAGEGAACYTQNLYIGDTVIHSEVGCLPGCNDEHLPTFFMWHETICCYSDRCNK